MSIIPYSKIKVSQLPFASASEVSNLDSLHLIKYPQLEGKQIQLSELSSYIGMSVDNFVVTASNSLDTFTASYSNNSLNSY